MTFSMVARCPETSALGVVTCTTGRAVGSAVPHAEEGVGAIATQATTNVFHGSNGLRLLKLGFEPRRVLESTLALDPHPEFRQVLIIDSRGRTAAHTGRENTDWKGHVEGEDYVVGGNNIVGPRVLEAMIRAFEGSGGEPLHERLLRAVEAGEEAGGCNRPDHTAALLVVGVEEEMKIYSRPALNLRVDSSDDPTKELRRVYESYGEFIGERRARRRNIRGF
ncbi:MAG: DUF1028 domain-containing protein [Candidatus Bathyarchaeota archaeon]|nr:DUF1028 domain-containing protein [Candidatus Bathyarchaeota archaeon]